MRYVRLCQLALIALLVPGSALAQGPGAPGGSGPPGPRLLRDTLPPGDPIAILLDRRAELKLTADQVTHLGDIQRRLHTANDTLVARLVTIRHGVPGGGRVHPRDMSPAQRGEFRHAVQEAHPLMQAIARNNVAAMAEVGGVLTEEQKAVVRTWLPHSAGAPGGRIPHGRGMGPRGGGGAGRGRGAAAAYDMSGCRDLAAAAASAAS